MKDLFDFYFRIYNKIIKDIKVLFKMQGGFRVDDTPVRRALREALGTNRTRIYRLRKK